MSELDLQYKSLGAYQARLAAAEKVVEGVRDYEEARSLLPSEEKTRCCYETLRAVFAALAAYDAADLNLAKHDE